MRISQRRPLIFKSLSLLLSLMVLPLQGQSQDHLKFDSVVIKITASENLDTWSRKKGHYDYRRKSSRVTLAYDVKSRTFRSRFFDKNTCFTQFRGDSLVRHADHAKEVRIFHMVSEDVIAALIKLIPIERCCQLKFEGNEIRWDKDCCRLVPEDFEIDSLWLKQNINRREILRRAKVHDRKWVFRDAYSMKEDRQKAYNGYSNLDSLKHFFIDFSPPFGVMYTSHIHKLFSVDVICGADTLARLIKVINPYSTQAVWTNAINDRQFYNPRINLIIDTMLPKRFLYKEIIKREFIKESYIDWILDRWE